MRISTIPFKTFLKNNRIKRDTVAEVCGISRRVVDAVCQNQNFSLDVVLKICSGLKIPITDVIELEDNGRPVRFDSKIEVIKETDIEDRFQFFLSRVFLRCEFAYNDFIKKHPDMDTETLKEIYKNAFFDCLDMVYEFNFHE